MHYKRVKHHKLPGIARALTFSCYRRYPLLDDEQFKVALADCVDDAMKAARFSLAGYVFMPEHVHLLVIPQSPIVDVSSLLSAIKRPCSNRIKKALREQNSPLIERLTVVERPGQKRFRFWQEGSGFDKDMTDPNAIREFIEYMHENPVERGLVNKPSDWKWSSWHFYETNTVPQGTPRVVKPPI